MKKTMSPQQIRRLRKSLKLTQQAFGNRLGVPQVTVGAGEAGMHEPRGLSLKALRELAEKAKKRKVESDENGRCRGSRCSSW